MIDTKLQWKGLDLLRIFMILTTKESQLNYLYFR
jgi:hypothetical protein